MLVLSHTYTSVESINRLDHADVPLDARKKGGQTKTVHAFVSDRCAEMPTKDTMLPLQGQAATTQQMNSAQPFHVVDLNVH